MADGTPLADGFVVTFDRAVDPATLNPAIPPAEPIAQVIYRDVNTSGSRPAWTIPVNPVITPLLEGNTSQGPTEFLVRFAPQGRIGHLQLPGRPGDPRPGPHRDGRAARS